MGDNSYMTALEALFVFLGVSIVVFLVCREILCWYWKINETLGVLKNIDRNLTAIASRSGGLNVPASSLQPVTPPGPSTSADVAAGLSFTTSGSNDLSRSSLGGAVPAVTLAESGRWVIDSRGASSKAIVERLYDLKFVQGHGAIDVIVGIEGDVRLIEDACFDSGRGFKLAGVNWRVVA